MSYAFDSLIISTTGNENALYAITWLICFIRSICLICFICFSCFINLICLISLINLICLIYFMRVMCFICVLCLKFKAWTRVIALQTLERKMKTLSVHVLCVLLQSIKFYGIECLIFNTHLL